MIECARLRIAVEKRLPVPRPALTVAAGAEFGPADAPARTVGIGIKIVSQDAEKAQIQIAADIRFHSIEFPDACFVRVCDHRPVRLGPMDKVVAFGLGDQPPKLPGFYVFALVAIFRRRISLGAQQVTLAKGVPATVHDVARGRVVTIALALGVPTLVHDDRVLLMLGPVHAIGRERHAYPSDDGSSNARVVGVGHLVSAAGVGDVLAFVHQKDAKGDALRVEDNVVLRGAIDLDQPQVGPAPVNAVVRLGVGVAGPHFRIVVADIVPHPEQAGVRIAEDLLVEQGHLVPPLLFANNGIGQRLGLVCRSRESLAFGDQVVIDQQMRPGGQLNGPASRRGDHLGSQRTEHWTHQCQERNSSGSHVSPSPCWNSERVLRITSMMLDRLH